MNICLFSAEELERPLDLRDERAVHLLKVLRKGEGDSFAAGVVGGRAGTALITRICGGGLEFCFSPESDGKPLNPLRMIVGFPRPIQLKRLLRDVAGIGACEIHLTGTELGEKSYMQSSLVGRGAAYKMLLDGVVQAGGTHVPKLFLHRSLPECLEAVRCGNADSGEILLALDNVCPSESLVGVLSRSPLRRNVVAAVGSERGWTQGERALLEEADFVRCGMGRRILRTETAATVAAAVISAFCGWLE